MKTYSISPYFDDFNDSNNFHQVLFKPGYAVQARELTQLQTILRGQIEKFGNHIFQHGSVVIPGNSYADLSAPYIKIESTFNGSAVNTANFVGKFIIGGETGIRAYVKKVVTADGSDPITMYLAYVTGAADGSITFKNGEEIQVENTSISANLLSSNATGVGSLAVVNTGVYYVNGTFVHVDGQIEVISKYTSTPSCHVLLRIDEKIITSEEDTTLLDPAQGSYNYAAPGADRVKISLVLTSIPIGTQWAAEQIVEVGDNIYYANNMYQVIIAGTLGTSAPVHTTGSVSNGTATLRYNGISMVTADYVELMRYNNGVLEEHSRNPKYSELEKSLARRTYDESGDYVVRGISPKIRQHLKTDTNGGLYTATEGGDNNKLVVEVSSGKAYINGFEIEKLANTRIDVYKARTNGTNGTPDHIKTTTFSIRPEFGQYIVVSNISKSLSVINHETITFYNDDTSSSPAVAIGTAKVVGIDYLAGDGSGAIYKLWINDISMVSTYKLTDAGSITYNSGGSAYVLTQLKAPINSRGFAVGELINYNTGEETVERTATVKYWDSAIATLYAYKHERTKETPRPGDSIIGSVSGTTSVITERTMLSSFETSSNLFALPKNVPFSLKPEDSTSYDFSYTVQREFTIIANSSGGGDATTTDGEIQPVETGTFLAIGPSGIISNSLFTVSGTNQITMANGAVASGSTVKVFANVLRRGSSGLTPKNKTLKEVTQSFKVWVASTSFSLNDNVFYKNNLYRVTTSGTTTTTAPTHTTGTASNGTVSLAYVSSLSKIRLSKTDIISLTSVIDATGDITNRYTFWDGQTDYFYDRGELRLSVAQSTPTTNFTVTYKHYEHSSTGDFFCIDSYPDKVSFLEQASVYTSQTNGYSYELGAYLDFRPSVGENGTWSGTGVVTNNLLVSGTTFSSSLQYYVPRIDSVVIDSSGTISVLTGIPSEKPIAPQVAINQLELNRIYFKEYTRALTDLAAKRMDVERFTMKDIKKITDRVSSLENYALLTTSELNALNYDVVDATTGLSRYKTGYIVETFKDPFSIARTTSKDYKASFVDEFMTAPLQPQVCDLNLIETGSETYTKSNNFITLPYTEEVFASQTLSSRTTNINPFLVVSWDGYLEVSPRNDMWVDVIDNPTVFENKTEEVIVNRYIPCPIPAITATLIYIRESDGVTKYQIIENSQEARSYMASLNSSLGRTIIRTSTVTGSSYDQIQNEIISKVNTGQLAWGLRVNTFTGFDTPGSTVVIKRRETNSDYLDNYFRAYTATDPVGTNVSLI